MVKDQRDTVIVTRPEPGLSETAQAVSQLGWRVVTCPVLEIEPLGAVPVEAVRAVLVTSGQALLSLAAWPRGQYLVAVGEKTAERARHMGFTHVEAAAGDATALEQYCRKEGLTGADVLLLSGRGYGVELAQSLGVRRREVYSVQPVQDVADTVRNALQSSCVRAVFFYSSRTADVFCALAHHALEQNQLSAVRALCLSEAIAARLQPKQWGSIEWGDPLALVGRGGFIRG